MGLGELFIAGIVAYFVLDAMSRTASQSADSLPSGQSSPAPLVNAPISATSTASNATVDQKINTAEDVPFSVPVPVAPVPITPNPNVADYGGTQTPTSGAVFQDAQSATDFTNQQYLAAIRPYMASGNAAGFLSLYGEIFDPSRNPVIADQMKTIGADVYSYFSQLQIAAPSGLTLAGMAMYYSQGMSQEGFLAWASLVKQSNPAQYDSWFTALAAAPMSDTGNSVSVGGQNYTVGQLVDMYNSAAAKIGWLPIVAVNVDLAGNINAMLQNGNSLSYSPQDFYAMIQGL